jgi:hypothetical protein
MAKATLHGSKANLSPRVPVARKIPRLRKFVEKERPGGKKRREWVHRDFATPDVVKALKAGGWNPPVSKHIDAAEKTIEACELPGETGRRVLVRQDDFDEIITEHDLSNDIRHVVADYVSKAVCQVEPKEFRLGAKKFHKWIAGAKAAFPAPGSALAEALNSETEKLDEDVPDIEHFRRRVRAYCEASECLLADEAGRGPDADRAKHELFLGLARIWEERTGRRPTRMHECGPFFEFLTAVNEQIPRRLRLTDSYIDPLTRTHFSGN